MQINLKKVAEICETYFDKECVTGDCPAKEVCFLFNENPCDWNIAGMEEVVKQFNRRQNKKTYC